MDLGVWKDKIVNSIVSWRSQDANRASEVGEQREEIAHLLELTGVHKKALSWIRALDKMEPEKREDVLRSFDALREKVMGPHWDGQKTPDMFADEEPVEPADEAPRKATYEQDFTVEDDPVDPEIAAEDAAFDAHLAEVAAQ